MAYVGHKHASRVAPITVGFATRLHIRLQGPELEQHLLTGFRVGAQQPLTVNTCEST